MSYFSAAAPQFPFFLPLQMLACVMALVLLVLHLCYREATSGD